MLSALVCLGRHTITGLLCASGRQFRDWSGDYRVFSESRFDPGEIFGVLRRGVVDSLKGGEPLITAMDDSILRKTGRKIPGVKYLRDPLGPPFHVNFVRAQRVIQLSGALLPRAGQGPARMVPLDFVHAPSPRKPRKDAPPEVWKAYRRTQREQSVSRVGVRRVTALRGQLDADASGRPRPLWVIVDGRFTNKPVLKDLPERTTLIGRIRSDAKLYHLPSPRDRAGRGRRRVYGDRDPTPEALRQDEGIPWQTVNVFAARKRHDLKVKTLSPLRWRSAGGRHTLRVIVIAPLAYRPRRGARLLYRKPAYLICTDPDLPLERVIQAYIWRWDIEVNFRDEKQILGVGEPQVRAPASVRTAPALLVAAYGMLLLAAARTFGPNGKPTHLPQPKWRSKKAKLRASTSDLIQHLRAELWGQALAVSNFSRFMDKPIPHMNPEKNIPDLRSAVLYAAG